MTSDYMIHSTGTSILKYVFGELIGDFFYAPLWWYSRGFLWFARRMRDQLISFERSVGLRLWITHLGKPMYGQYDIASKIISFFLRLFLLFVKFVEVLAYIAWLTVKTLLWFLIPIFIVWQIIAQIAGLFVVS